MTVGLKLLRLAGVLGMSDADLSRALGVARSTVAAYKRGKTSPTPDKVGPFLAMVRMKHQKTVPIAWVFDGQDTPPPIRDSSPLDVVRTSAMPTSSVRLVGSVGAGNGEDSTADDDILQIPMHLSGDDYVAWRVVGDSMMPLLEPGDVAVFRESAEPKSREIALFRLADGTHLCKQQMFQGRWVFHSLNPAYPDEPAPMDSTRLGLLVGVWRSIGTREMILFDFFGLRET